MKSFLILSQFLVVLDVPDYKNEVVRVMVKSVSL